MEITQKDIIKNYREVNAEQDYKIRMLEAENQRLKAQLDKEIKESRYLLNRLWIISKHLHKESGTSNETLIGYIEKLLKEFDYNPPIDKDKKFVVRTFTINLQDGEE